MEEAEFTFKVNMAFSPFVSVPVCVRAFRRVSVNIFAEHSAYGNITADCMTSDKVSLVSFLLVKLREENYHEPTQLELEQPLFTSR